MLQQSIPADAPVPAPGWGDGGPPPEPQFLKDWLAHHVFDPAASVVAVLAVAVLAYGVGRLWWSYRYGDAWQMHRAKATAGLTFAAALLGGLSFGLARAAFT